jgi:hypothetical protein
VIGRPVGSCAAGTAASGLAVPGFPAVLLGQAGWCRHGPHGGVGSSLLPILWSGRVTPFPSPCSLSEPTSPDHQRSSVVPAGLGRGLSERPEPVLGTPLGGVGGVDGDHPEPTVGGHLDQAVPELCGRDTRYQPAERPATPAPTGTPAGALASLLTCGGEVEVLDHDSSAAMRPGQAKQRCDRCRRRPSRVGVERPARSRLIVTGTPMGLPHESTTTAASCPALRSTARTGCSPSSSTDGTWSSGSSRTRPGTSAGDPAHSRGRSGLPQWRPGRPPRRPGGQGDRSGQPPAAMRPVGEVGERRGELDLHPAPVRVEADRLVAPPLGGLTIGADEQAGRLPPLLPLHRGDPDLIEVVPGPGKAPTTPADRHPPSSSRASTRTRRDCSTCRRRCCW